MYRIVLALALLALFAAPASAQTDGRAARVTQVDTTGYPDVTLYVSVTDANGAPVPGLAQSDFALTEDGQPVDVTSFVGGGAGPVNTVLVIDRSGSMDEADKMEGAQDAAQAFVEQMRPADQTALLSFNSEPRLRQEFTSDQGDLSREIGQIDASGGTAIYDSIIAGVDALKGTAGRKALLLLTDGQDCRESTNCPSDAGSEHSREEAIAYANQQGQPVYVIGLGERASTEDDGIDEASLQQIAQQTNGAYFYAPDAEQLAALYRSISSDIQQEYSLTYTSPRPFYDGTRRDIQVLVGGTASTSSGYVEQHMIHVRSAPEVALLLFVPVLLLLMLPGLLARRRGRGKTVPSAGPTALATAAPTCTSCAAPLQPADARFCIACGANQAPAAPRRTFCDQCGQPLRAGAKFCSHCGEQTIERNAISTGAI